MLLPKTLVSCFCCHLLVLPYVLTWGGSSVDIRFFLGFFIPFSYLQFMKSLVPSSVQSVIQPATLSLIIDGFIHAIDFLGSSL